MLQIEFTNVKQWERVSQVILSNSKPTLVPGSVPSGENVKGEVSVISCSVRQGLQ